MFGFRKKAQNPQNPYVEKLLAMMDGDLATLHIAVDEQISIAQWAGISMPRDSKEAVENTAHLLLERLQSMAGLVPYEQLEQRVIRLASIQKKFEDASRSE